MKKKLIFKLLIFCKLLFISIQFFINQIFEKACKRLEFSGKYIERDSEFSEKGNGKHFPGQVVEARAHPSRGGGSNCQLVSVSDSNGPWTHTRVYFGVNWKIMTLAFGKNVKMWKWEKDVHQQRLGNCRMIEYITTNKRRKNYAKKCINFQMKSFSCFYLT